ncbi:MAG: hypothetical protein COB51_06360 [Moraxellaceae bacterium]|nr:MAG: hypothetical protein COB51_06360 [Moraxellaceae bacterium]
MTEEIQPPSSEQPNNERAEPSKSSSKLTGFMASLAFVMAVGGVGAAGYLWTQFQEIKADHAASVSGIRGEFAEQKSTVGVLSGQSEAAEEALRANALLAEQLKAQVTALSEKIAGITGLHEVDWRISQAEHLAQAAQQRLALTNDLDGAQSLLDAANGVLAEVKEIGIIDVRRAFAKDILMLKAASRVDVAGTFVKLDVLNESIQQLSLPPVKFEAQPVDVKVASVGSGYQEDIAVGFENLWSKINSQWETQQLDQPIKPILSTDQRAYLKQNLALLMEQAQLAVMKRDPVVYERILQQAQTWTETHFNMDSPTAGAVLATFEELKSVKLSPITPDISEAVRALAMFSEHWRQEKIIRQQQVNIQQQVSIQPQANIEPKVNIQPQVNIQKPANIAAAEVSEDELPGSDEVTEEVAP